MHKGFPVLKAEALRYSSGVDFAFSGIRKDNKKFEQKLLKHYSSQCIFSTSITSSLRVTMTKRKFKPILCSLIQQEMRENAYSLFLLTSKTKYFRK